MPEIPSTPPQPDRKPPEKPPEQPKPADQPPPARPADVPKGTKELSTTEQAGIAAKEAFKQVGDRVMFFGGLMEHPVDTIYGVVKNASTEIGHRYDGNKALGEKGPAAALNAVNETLNPLAHAKQASDRAERAERAGDREGYIRAKVQEVASLTDFAMMVEGAAKGRAGAAGRGAEGSEGMVFERTAVTERKSAAAGEKPVDTTTAKNPVDKAADKPAEKPLETPVEKGADKPGGKAADKPAEKPSDKPVEKGVDKPVQKTADAPAEKPGGKAADKPAATNPGAGEKGDVGRSPEHERDLGPEYAKNSNSVGEKKVERDVLTDIRPDAVPMSNKSRAFDAHAGAKTVSLTTEVKNGRLIFDHRIEGGEYLQIKGVERADPKLVTDAVTKSLQKAADVLPSPETIPNKWEVNGKANQFERTSDTTGYVTNYAGPPDAMTIILKLDNGVSSPELLRAAQQAIKDSPHTADLPPVNVVIVPNYIRTVPH